MERSAYGYGYIKECLVKKLSLNDEHPSLVDVENDRVEVRRRDW